MGRSYREEKSRRPRSYDLFGLFPFYMPTLGGSWLMVGVFFLLQIVLGFVFILPFALGTLDGVSMSLLLYVATFAVLLMICANISRSRAFTADYGLAVTSRHFGPYHPVIMALAVTVGMLATVVALDPLTSLVQHYAPGASDFEAQMKKLLEGNSFLLFLNVVVFAPLFEELFVRGMLLRGMLSHIRPGWAIFWSALMFAVMHQNLIQGFSALAIGMLMGYTYYRTGCLWLTMLMHFANNLVGFILMETAPGDAQLALSVPVWAYVLAVVAGICLTLLYLRMLRRIPLEQPRGNLDVVRLEDLV